MKEVIYTVYYLEEVLSPIGKPYVGVSKDLINRAKHHRYHFKLDNIPTLIPIKTFYDKTESRKFENIKRVENGWQKESHINGKNVGNISGPRHKENKTGIFGLSEEEKLKNQSEGGKKMKGKVWINNGSNNKRVLQERLKEFYDQGYVNGRLDCREYKPHSGDLKRFGINNIGKIRITNGIVNKSIKKDEDIPLGFWRGMTVNK